MKTVIILFSIFTLSSSEWIDMSHVFDNTTISWGNSTTFQHNVVYKGKVSDDIPYYSSYDITTAEHSGTHLDAPIHFSEGKWSVDEIPPDKLVGQAVVIDISVKASKDRNVELNVVDLEKWEKQQGRIPHDSILFVLTGWGKYWPNYEQYMGTNTTNSKLYRFPGIHKNASQWLVDNRKIKGIGIDTASLDYGLSTTYQTHQILFKSNIYALENVANLEKLPATGATVYALPMKIRDGSGGPVRIFATTGDDLVCHNSASISMFGSFWLTIVLVTSFM